MPITDDDVRRYEHVVQAVCQRLYLPGAEHADMLQEARTGLVIALRTYDASKGSIESWVYTVARRRCLTMLRMAQYEKRRVPQ